MNSITEENYMALVELNKSMAYISEALEETETESKELVNKTI